MSEPREVGLEWGFAQPHEATAYPMTTVEYKRWHGTWQASVMMAFKLMENLVRLDLPKWEMSAADRRKTYLVERKAATWATQST